MPKVSIIVPIYNSEIHLSRCIDSILAQTYTDFELILINDGSNDKSREICDYYATKDRRIIVVHKENGGTSSARNRGLNVANGEYITFVDSDDTITTDYLSTFTYNCDFEIAGLETIGMNKTIYVPMSTDTLSVDTKIADWFVKDSDAMYLTTICCKMFRTNIIQKSFLKFDTSLKRGEDTIFVYNYLSYCNSIKLLSNVVYQYNFDATSIDKKYSLNSKECVNHICAKVSSIEKIEKRFNVKLKELSKLTHTTYLHLFYTHLKSIHRDKKISELKIFRDNTNKLQLWQALNIKDYIYWRILPVFPSLQRN